jgi:FkbM family methyltransferase
MSIRIIIVQYLINALEQIFFYPKLKNYYKSLKLNKPFTIIDVGANKGQSIDFFLSLYPSAIIHAFEPNRKLFLMLVKKYKFFQNIKLYNLGISNVNGNLRFYQNILDETSSFELVRKNSQYLKKKASVLGVTPNDIITTEYDVDVITLSHFFSSNDIRDVSILKIDVEGHEFQCLEGLMPITGINIDIIQLEKHNDDMYEGSTFSKDIPAVISLLNMELAKTIAHPFGNFDELIYTIKIVVN